jgi:two-component system, NtrC family, response regulator AtoC
MNNVTVLVVDDEAHMRRVLEIMVRQLGHNVLGAADGAQALQMLEREKVDLVLTDLRMPVLDGLGLLRGMVDKGMNVPAIVMTAQGSVSTAVEAMKLGAEDYLLRPFDVDVLELSIHRVLERGQLRIENSYLREQVERPDAEFFGTSAAMQHVFEQVLQVGPTRASVLITGETGTGKELAARAVHRASGRRDNLFVPVNCAAMPADMVEAELFGHERGAFTGAVKERIGKFELASKGTIFLDEITEMPIGLQSKLLRVLQESRIERLGGNRTIDLDMRVVAACNQDPREAIRSGTLREDLFYRLNVFSLALPPLRERPEDIEGLVHHLAAKQGRRVEVSPDALACLRRYPWPGNVRELENVVQRALILSRERTIELRHLPADMSAGTAPGSASSTPVDVAADASLASMSLDLGQATEALEERLIAEALRRTDDNKRRAAALLGISERTLWYKLGRAAK